jgi:uncharacterized protein
MKLLVRVIFYVAGLVILTFGICISIKSNLGAGPWDALNAGLSKTAGLTIGSWVIIIGIILMMVNAWLLKAKPDYLALMTICLIGFMADFWILRVFSGVYILNLYWQIAALVIGLALIGLGAAVYLQAQFPLNPIDQFMVALKERLGISLMLSKTIGEAGALVLALAFHGPVGAGTIVIAVLIGPFIQLFFPYCQQLLKRFSGT